MLKFIAIFFILPSAFMTGMAFIHHHYMPAHVPNVFAYGQHICLNDFHHCAVSRFNASETLWAMRDEIKSVSFIASKQVEKPVILIKTK